jgi:AcrR family transcriptional regulator
MSISGVEESELTAYARIRRAALVSFARLGMASTTIRGVAAAAGVSPGLVQHHFRSKEGLRAAVDAFVLERASKAVDAAAGGGSSAEVAAGFGERIADFIRSSPDLVAYARRALLEGDPSGLALFDALVDLARSELERLAAEGLLRSDLDLTWTALHIVLLNAAPVLLEAAVDRHLEQPFLSEEGITRWRESTSLLITKGVYRSGNGFSPGANDLERS